MRHTEDHTLRTVQDYIQQARLRLAGHMALPNLTDQEGSDLRQSVRDEGSLTSGYILMCALSAGIATLGLLQSSAAVVIGAMLVSPLMGPIAALGFGFASLDGHRIRDALRVVLVGAIIGVVAGMVITWISPIRNATPEIVGRTQPTLLDLAIALLSGIAGGYATVRQKGGTAIGVAIATALMPPLATVGYAIGVANWQFAGGASLLFLTNLAAISFSFALIARLSGAARPFSRVEVTVGYVAVGIAAFMALATPLGLTLVRVSRETQARRATRDILSSVLQVSPGKIAQLELTWPLLGDLSIDAVVIEPSFVANAQPVVDQRLQQQLGVPVHINLQQIVAADNGEQTRAMIDAALERNLTGIARDLPPYEQIRNRVGLPLQSLWVDRGARIVHIIPADAPGWTLEDYRDIETTAGVGAGDWKVRVVPPTSRALSIPFVALSPVPDSLSHKAQSLTLWALQRWGVAHVELVASPPPGDSSATRIAGQRIASLTTWLTNARIRATPSISGTSTNSADEITLSIFPPSPSELRKRTAVANQ